MDTRRSVTRVTTANETLNIAASIPNEKQLGKPVMNDLPQTAEIERLTTTSRIPLPGLLSVFNEGDQIVIYVQDGPENRYRNLAVFALPIAEWHRIVKGIGG
jgi:hypothetical protein